MDDRGRASGRLSHSIPALLFAVFFCANLLRLVVVFGTGLAVAFGWSSVIGGASGGAIGLVVGGARLFGDRSVTLTGRIHSAFIDAIACLMSGGIGGVIGGALGFAAATIGTVEHVSVRGVWFETLLDPGRPQPVVDTAFPVIVLAPAIIVGVSNAVASALGDLRNRPFLYIARVGCATAFIAGLMGTAALFAVASVNAPPTRIQGPGDENMLGLLPLAIVLWYAIGAAIGGLSGAVCASFWVWASHTRTNRISWIVFWCVAALLVVFMTEVAARRWFKLASSAVAEHVTPNRRASLRLARSQCGVGNENICFRCAAHADDPGG